MVVWGSELQQVAFFWASSFFFFFLFFLSFFVFYPFHRFFTKMTLFSTHPHVALMDIDGRLHWQQNKLQWPKSKSYFMYQIDCKLKLDRTKIYFIQKTKKHTHPLRCISSLRTWWLIRVLFPSHNPSTWTNLRLVPIPKPFLFPSFQEPIVAPYWLY